MREARNAKAFGDWVRAATGWKVDDADKKKWTFKLRPGVKFHDGSDFNADAVVWNVEKVLKQDAPQFDASQVGVTASRMPTLASAKKIDDMTVELTTKEPDSFLPINLTNLFMASPAKWQKLFEAAEGADAKAKSQAAWAAFAREASGTGPWKMSKFTPRERLELVKNDSYWNKDRVPKVDRMVLLPMPEANARTAALLSGQVDWVEAPAPDAVKEIKGRGFTITANEEPHVWPWQFSRVEGSPWNDIRVRKAANLCVDREGLRDGLLAGLMVVHAPRLAPGTVLRVVSSLPIARCCLLRRPRTRAEPKHSRMREVNSRQPCTRSAMSRVFMSCSPTRAESCA